MKKALLFILLLTMILTLAGCRVRVVDDPALADSVVQPETPPPEQPETPEPPQPPEEPEPPQEPEMPQEPEVTEPEPPQEPEETPADNALVSRPETVTTLSTTGPAAAETQAAAGVTVTYEPNGGDTAAVSTVVRTGEAYGVQPEAVRRGFSFAGWWTAPQGGTQIFADTIVTETSDHTLYARWQDRQTCTVTFDGNGGRVKSREARLELSDGDAYGVLPVPLREGYQFDGWFTAPDGGEAVTETSVFSGSADITLYAHWTYDPFAFWSFTLQNHTQQVYLCQQISIYYEGPQDNITERSLGLISSTGSLNIAENLDSNETTDEWVLGKRPQVVLKCAGSQDPDAVRQAVQQRFPEQEVLVVSSAALGDGAEGLYARLALAKHLYPDWYGDVDLDTVAAELGVTDIPIYF